jgi:hypothetical protein
LPNGISGYANRCSQREQRHLEITFGNRTNWVTGPRLCRRPAAAGSERKNPRVTAEIVAFCGWSATQPRYNFDTAVTETVALRSLVLIEFLTLYSRHT